MLTETQCIRSCVYLQNFHRFITRIHGVVLKLYPIVIVCIMTEIIHELKCTKYHHCVQNLVMWHAQRLQELLVQVFILL